MAKLNKGSSRSNSALRIIGGRWRGRKLNFPEVEGLRPTPDRVRETLFNWLQPTMAGAKCLDLFAGSGALGFEAASRGAKKVVLIEQNRQAFEQLKLNCETLSAVQCKVIHQSAQQYLMGNRDAYDIVFIDPPYQADLWAECAQKLMQGGWLKMGARIYLECPRREPLPNLSEHWALIRDKKAGDIRYCLLVNQMENNV